MGQGEIFQTATAARESAEGAVTNTLAATATLAETVASVAGTPYWESPFDGDTVSMPWSAVTATYTLASGSNQVVFIPIIVRKDGVADTLRIASATLPGGISTVNVGLMKLDRATGDMTEIFDSGNILTDYDTTYRTGAIVSVPMPQINLQQGEAYAVAVRQRGTNQPGLFGGVNGSVDRTVTSGYPTDVVTEMTAAKAGGTDIPASGQATASTSAFYYTNTKDQTVWAALGIASVPTVPVNYIEYYSTAGPLSTNLWLPRYAPGAGLRAINGGLAAATNSDTNDYIYTYKPQVHHEDHQVTIARPSVGGNVPNRIYLLLRSSDTAQCWALWDIENGDADIYTSTSWGITGTSRASGAAPTTFKGAIFSAVGNVYTLQCVDVNGLPIEIAWTDGGSAHPTDATQRIVGKGIACPAVSNSWPFADAWTASDL